MFSQFLVELSFILFLYNLRNWFSIDLSIQKCPTSLSSLANLNFYSNSNHYFGENHEFSSIKILNIKTELLAAFNNETQTTLYCWWLGKTAWSNAFTWDPLQLVVSINKACFRCSRKIHLDLQRLCLMQMRGLSNQM